MHPRKEQGAYHVWPVFGDLLPGPLIIFNRADDEFDFVGRFQEFEICPAIAFGLAAAGTFQIHDAPDARVNRRDVMRTASAVSITGLLAMRRISTLLSTASINTLA